MRSLVNILDLLYLIVNLPSPFLNILSPNRRLCLPLPIALCLATTGFPHRVERNNRNRNIEEG